MMSNSKGIYVGAVLRCEVDKVSTTSFQKHCPVHGAAYGDYCSVCGTQTVHVTTTAYPIGSDILGDDETMQWLPSERQWMNGVLFFCSNLGGHLEMTSVDSDLLDDPTQITPELIQQHLANFVVAHADEIAKISAQCKSYSIIWAVVPWWEF